MKTVNNNTITVNLQQDYLGCDRMRNGIDSRRKGALVFNSFLWPPVLYNSHYHNMSLDPGLMTALIPTYTCDLHCLSLS